MKLNVIYAVYSRSVALLASMTSQEPLSPSACPRAPQFHRATQTYELVLHIAGISHRIVFVTQGLKVIGDRFCTASSEFRRQLLGQPLHLKLFQHFQVIA